MCRDDDLLAVWRHFDFHALVVAFGDFHRSGLFLKILCTVGIAKIDSHIFGNREGAVFAWRDATKRAYSARIRHAGAI